MNNFKSFAYSAALAMLLVSCNDIVKYEDEIPDVFASSGAPVITAIYAASDTAAVPVQLESGMLNQMLCITGQNLSHVKRVSFNGLEVDLRSVYAESTRAYVKIPRKIPEVVTNQMEYETTSGMVTREFPVGIPSLEVDGLKNEFCLPGRSVQVLGDYFDLFGYADTTATSTAKVIITATDSDSMPYEAEVHADSITETYMSIPIPEDCPDNALITFQWEESTGTKHKAIPYRMTRELLYGGDVSLGLSWGDWDSGKELICNGTGAGEPESLGFDFIRVTGSYSEWSWHSCGLGGNWHWLDASVHPEDYVLKFEICTNKNYPYYSYGDAGFYSDAPNGGYYITLNAPKDVRNQFDPISCWGISNTYGEWVTVTIPLTQAILTSTLPTEPDQWVGLEFVLQPNKGDWTVDHSFGQFRIEPKNY